MTYRVAHRRPVSGSSQATEPAVRGQRFPQFVVYAIGGPDQVHAQATPLTGVLEVYSAYGHSCALLSGGTVRGGR